MDLVIGIQVKNNLLLLLLKSTHKNGPRELLGKLGNPRIPRGPNYNQAVSLMRSLV
jgi:hypothetical protein